uniref:palmitoyl-CoA hydrolase n=1 Tax=Oryzias latipes TaxID=8090 RepID=A0A3P9IJ34_ORYLA
MSMKTFSFILTPAVLMLLLAAGWTSAYKPVILVHGILSGPRSFKMLTGFINKAHPGTKVTVIDLFNYGNSTKPMWKQVEGFANVIPKIMEKSPEGVHLLCFSQEGLICRGVLSTLPNHNVHSFIVLSSPLAGQYGVLDVLHKNFPLPARELVLETATHVFSADPHHRKQYLESSNFLPLLNGEKPHSKMAGTWRKNFLRIKKLVLIGGPDDNVITPWQSSLFGFYNHNEEVVEMKEQTFYKNDTFGLKTLDTRGDISVCSQPGVKHFKWHSNKKVFDKCIKKWLD